MGGREFSWLLITDKQVIANVNGVKRQIQEAKGVLNPDQNSQALGMMTNYYDYMTERAGKSRAMRDQFFANLLLTDGDLSISKAEAIAKGSDFGQMTSYFEKLSEGYLEILQTLKKAQEYWSLKAQNKI